MKVCAKNSVSDIPSPSETTPSYPNGNLSNPNSPIATRAMTPLLPPASALQANPTQLHYPATPLLASGNNSTHYTPYLPSTQPYIWNPSPFARAGPVQISLQHPSKLTWPGAPSMLQATAWASTRMNGHQIPIQRQSVTAHASTSGFSLPTHPLASLPHTVQPHSAFLPRSGPVPFSMASWDCREHVSHSAAQAMDTAAAQSACGPVAHPQNLPGGSHGVNH